MGTRAQKQRKAADVAEESGSVAHETVPERGRWRRRIFWAAGALAILTLLVFGRSIAGHWSRAIAARHMDAWAISAALQWLDTAHQLDPGSSQTELMRARCYRYLGELDRRAAAMALARQYGASPEDLRNEETLGKIQTGELPEGAEAKLAELTEAGLSPHDIASVFVHDCIVRRDMQRAELLLQAWASDFPNQAHNFYMRGVFLAANNDHAGALEQLQRALMLAPRHQLAQIAVAQIYNQRNQLDKALELYVKLADLDPANKSVLIGLARVLRKTGRLQQARSVLAPIVSQGDPAVELAVEMGEIELESGDYREADTWFEQVPAIGMTNHDTLTAAAMTLAILGQTTRAERAFHWIEYEVMAVGLLHDLEGKLAIDPNDLRAAGARQRMIQDLGTRSTEANPLAMPPANAPAGNTTQDKATPGRELYAEQCGACHGANGNGNGRAARHLFPVPRDLRSERMRLVTTRNGIPTLADIRKVIRDGIPGTSMVERKDLSDEQLDLLADVVLTMRREGVRDDYVALLREDDEPIDEEEVLEVVNIQTTPGEPEIVPQIPPADASSIARGKELYVTHTCHSCHGETGEGDDKTPLFDDKGRPSFPRDLVSDAFKGGNDASSIYLRIRLGMPGSPHPANVSLTQEELFDLVHYSASLGREPKSALTNHARAVQASSRPAIEFVSAP